jgi:DNA-directed RNA polymerase beta' subunit
MSSFYDGTNPTEFYMESMGAKIGLIDTAISTAGVGYLDRQILKNTEDVKIEKDYGVYNVGKSLIQGIYGFDGLEPREMETIKTKFGEIPSFINLERVAGRINGTFGYTLEGKKWIKK